MIGSVRTGVLGLLLALGFFSSAIPALAGPPYVTDDPEPTDYRNWEIYVPGFLYANTGRGAFSAALPFAEFNYGALPNIQTSISFTQADDDTANRHDYRYGDTDIAIKYRFVQETDARPQIAFYPSVDVPANGGPAVVFLPVWMQKSSGPWTAFGGGGLSLNPGPGKRDYTFVGGALTRAISPGTTVGVELFHQGADTIADSDTTGTNIGVESQIGQYHAILFSFGRALHGDNTFSAYLAYKFALGPPSQKAKLGG